MQAQICSVRICVTILTCMSRGIRGLTFDFWGHKLKEKYFRDVIPRCLRLKLTDPDSVGGRPGLQINSLA